MISTNIEELYRRLSHAEASWDLGIQELPDLSSWDFDLLGVFNTPLDAPENVAKINQKILEKMSRIIRLQRDHSEQQDDVSVWTGMRLSADVVKLAEARWPADNRAFFTADETSVSDPVEYLKRGDRDGERWNGYRNHLIERGNRSYEAVDALDGEVSQIVGTVPRPIERIGSKAHHVLVVGYTQSGKTQNFLGVASRLADAGYRLIIILSGRTEILGAQTQRRVDRDLVGMGGAEDGDLFREYEKDEVQRTFTTNPKSGSTMAWKSLSRLVGGKHKLSLGGLQTLAAGQSTAYVAVCKKTTGDLNMLKNWAKEQGVAGRSNWPTILIDEEADDASPDTKQKADHQGWMTREQPEDASFVHRSILELRDAFNIRTYIGYTATPYANCLADPDSDGLFPDAIYVMKMPNGYFGSHKVFDFVSDPSSISELQIDGLRNESIHVEEVEFSTIAEADQARISALKSWLVAGVVKEFRRKNRGGVIAKMLRHHSLLVNVHSSKNTHDDEYAAFKRILESPAFSFSQNRPAAIAKMLWHWYEEKFHETTLRMIKDGKYDFATASGQAPLSEGDLPTELQFTQVAEGVIEFLRNQFRKDKLAGDYPLQIVNSKAGTNEPNYDDQKLDREKGLWVILIGGNKLSRGFTVEGLTTTYFGRVSKTVDTMLQQARWNGFRAYYEDLVRLYFQHDSEKKDADQPLALFRGAALTEFDTRKSLEQYSAADGAKINPKDFLPGISGIGKRAPTNRTKMKGAIGNDGFEVGLVWGLNFSDAQLIRDVAARTKPLEYTCGCAVNGPMSDGKQLAAKLLEGKDVVELYDAVTRSKSRPGLLRDNIVRAEGRWIGFLETDKQATSVRHPRAKDEGRSAEEQARQIALRDGAFNNLVKGFADGLCPSCKLPQTQILKVAGTMFIVSNSYEKFTDAPEGQPRVPTERQYGMQVKFSGGAEYFSGRSRDRPK